MIMSIEFQAVSWNSGDEEVECDDGTRQQYMVKAFGKNADGKSVYAKVSYNPRFFVEIPSGWSGAHRKAFVNGLRSKVCCEKCKDGPPECISKPRANGCPDKFQCRVCRSAMYTGRGECTHNLTVAQVVHSKKFYGFTNGESFPFYKLVFSNKSSFTKAMYAIKRLRINKKHELDWWPKNPDVGYKLTLYEANFDPMLRFCHSRNTPPAGWFKIPEGKFTLCEDKESYCDIEIEADHKDVEKSDNPRIAPLVIASFDIETYSPDGSFPDPHKKECHVIQIGTTLQRFGESEPYKKSLISLRGCAPIEGVDVECYADERDVLNAWSRMILDENVDIILGYNIWKFDLSYMYTRAVMTKAAAFLNTSRLRDVDCEFKKTQFSSSAYGDNDYEMVSTPGIFQIDLLVIMQREHKLTSYKLDAVAEHFLKERKVDLSALEMFKKWAHGTDEDRRDVGVYCVQDTSLPLRLVNKLAIVPNMVEMAKATWVPINFLIERGQGIKVFSQILYNTLQNDMLVLTRERDPDQQQEEYEGATVLGAKKGAYTEIPITGLDFASLYPTIMMAHNLCHSTYVNDERYDNLDGVEYFQYEKCRFAQTTEGVLPNMLRNLAKNRKQAKKDMAKAKEAGDMFMYAVYNGKQLAFKVSMNSIYGFCGASIGALPCKEVAASTTGIGRGMIEHTKNCVEEWYPGSDVVYGDSVAGDTPLLLRIEGVVRVSTIQDLVRPHGYTHRRDGKESAELENIETWTSQGWTRVHRVIRHRVAPDKRMLRVLTTTGMVECTEDHSLISAGGVKISPNILRAGDHLLASFPYFADTQRANEDVMVFNHAHKASALLGFLQLRMQGCRATVQMTEKNIVLKTSKEPIQSGVVLGVVPIVHDNESFVYDLTTENHEFHAGVGDLICHNTDSVMVKFNVGDKRGQEAIEESFRLGEEAAERISATFKNPIELEFEKVYYPYLLFSKKRYAGLMYTNPKAPDYIDAKGIQLVRRDNCKMVRDVSKALLDVIMYERDIQKAIGMVKDVSRKLLSGGIDVMDLVVTKSLKRIKYIWTKTERDDDGNEREVHLETPELEHAYKMASQPHLTVAQKLESRRRGTGPKSGERVPYVFIDTGNPKDKQFVKAEDPTYAKENNLALDCKYYLEHALLSPIQSLFELFLENPKEELFGEFLPKKRTRKKKEVITIDV
jgi:DNA polymerase elongation subunit (family B)